MSPGKTIDVRKGVFHKGSKIVLNDMQFVSQQGNYIVFEYAAVFKEAHRL